MATAGESDRLVKVWQLQSKPGGEAHYDFAYLRHPAVIKSLEWRPPERAMHTPEPPRHVGDDVGGFNGGSGDAAILLTLCEDGIPRLWRNTMQSEPTPLRMFLCGTLAVDNDARDELSTAASRVLQLAQWLRPTARAALQPPWHATIGGDSITEIDSDSLSPGARPPPSPLLGPGLGVPTLRPSLREPHDYVLGQLSDGTLVVWLLLGLSADPRTAPKLMVWATLPCVLPSVESVACVAAFCNLEANGPNGAFPAILAHRAESDQLPSTVSLLQRTGSPDHPVRLCTIDVNRGVTGERVHQRLLRGHSAVPGCDVVALLPHPHSSLAASLSSSG